MPVFVIGAGVGRLFGEIMAIAFPQGLHAIGDSAPLAEFVFILMENQGRKY